MVQVNVQVKLLEGRTPLLFAWWNKAEGTVNACLVSCPCQDLELENCVAQKPYSCQRNMVINDNTFNRALQSSEVISIIDEECAPDFSLVAALKQYRAINAAKKKMTLAKARREKVAAANWRIRAARMKAKGKASLAEKARAVGQEKGLLYGCNRESKTQGTANRTMANDNNESKTISATPAVEGPTRRTRNADGKKPTTPLMPGSSLSPLSDSYHYAITPPTTDDGSKEITSVGATMSTAIRSKAMASNGTQHKHMIVGGTPKGTTRADGQSTAGSLVSGQTPGAKTANTLGTLLKVTGGTIIRDPSTHKVIGGTPEGTMSADGQSTAGPLMSGLTSVTPSLGLSERTTIDAPTTVPVADRTVDNVNKGNKAWDTSKVIVGGTPGATNDSRRDTKKEMSANLLLKLSNGAVLKVPLAMLKSKFPTTSSGGTTGGGDQVTVRSNSQSTFSLKLSNGTTMRISSALFAGHRTIANETSEGSLRVSSNSAKNIGTGETHDDSSSQNTQPTSSTVDDQTRRSERKRKPTAKCVNSAVGAWVNKKTRTGSPSTDGFISLETTGAAVDLAPSQTANCEKWTKPQVGPSTKIVTGAPPNDPNCEKLTKIQAEAKTRKVSGAAPKRKKQTKTKTKANTRKVSGAVMNCEVQTNTQAEAKTQKTASAPIDGDKRAARERSGSSDSSSPEDTTDMSADETSDKQGGDNKPVSKSTLQNTLTICELCGKSVTKRYLQGHIEAYHHQGEREKRYKCQLCDSSYFHSQHLRKHVRVVHELVRYKCRFCDKWLTDDFVRKLHENTHFPKDEPIFPYKRKRGPEKKREELKNRTTVCELCGLTVKKYQIHNHHRRHKKPYPCNICGRFYSNWLFYRTHMNKHHPGRPLIPKIVDPSQPDSVQSDALPTVADSEPLLATTSPAATAEDGHQTPYTNASGVDVSLDVPTTEQNTTNQKTKSKKKRKKKDKDREEHKRSKRQKKTINTDPEDPDWVDAPTLTLAMEQT